MHADTPLLLFAIATFAGGAFATLSPGPRPLPLALAVVQGALSVAAFVVLLAFVVATSQPPGLLIFALGLFGVAATGAVVLFRFHRDRRALPRPLAYLHTIGTSTAYACLALSVLAS